MKAQRTLIAAALLLLAPACQQRVPRDQEGQGSTTPAYERAEATSPLDDTVAPVRIGELGPNFPACTGRGRPRERAGAGAVPVRAAPFDQAQQIDQLEAGSTFYLCSRSLDQRWFGIVYDEARQAGEPCGVSRPISGRRDYEGPCAAGWVPSSLVTLTSGATHQPQPEEERPSD